MRRLKKIAASVLMIVLLCMCSVGAFAAEAGCDHDWRMYDKTHAYSEDLKTCDEHENCWVKIDGYLVRWKCSKCGAEKSNTVTEKLHISMTREGQ